MCRGSWGSGAEGQLGSLCPKGPGGSFSAPRAMLDVGGGGRVHAVACGPTSTFLCVQTL